MYRYKDYTLSSAMWNMNRFFRHLFQKETFLSNCDFLFAFLWIPSHKKILSLHIRPLFDKECKHHFYSIVFLESISILYTIRVIISVNRDHQRSKNNSLRNHSQDGCRVLLYYPLAYPSNIPLLSKAKKNIHSFQCFTPMPYLCILHL